MILMIDMALKRLQPGNSHSNGEEEVGAMSERLDSRIDSLAELSVVEAVEHDSEVQYTLNANSSVVDRLYELSVTVQRVRNGDRETTSDSENAEEPLEK